MNDFHINELSLDQEWLQQPILVHRYALELAERISEVEQIENELKVVRAELNTSIRNNPEDYDLPKATDTIVEAAIPGQPEYQVVLKRLLDAKKRRRIVDAACQALEHKKKALENMVQLNLRDYYSTPKDKSPKGGRGRGGRGTELSPNWEDE